MLQARALYCWYVREDLALRAALDRHLGELRRAGVVEAIDEDLEWADVVLLLVSTAFLASEESRGPDMSRLVTRHRAGWARVIPVLAHEVDCSGAPFADLPFLPMDGHCRPLPVSAWSDREQALASVARAIRAAFAGR